MEKLIWICPRCKEEFYGWSKLLLCYNCGYCEKTEINSDNKEEGDSGFFLDFYNFK